MKGRKEKRTFTTYLALYGCVSTGLVYTAVGVIAILSFLQLKQGGADESSLVAYLDQYLVGRLAIWFILLGMISYIIWRIYQAAKDPYAYGKDAKGLAQRTGIALSSIADGLIAFTALQALFSIGQLEESGPPVTQRQMMDNLMQKSWGDWVVVGIGVVIALTALVQFAYGITRGYREKMNIDHLAPWAKGSIHVAAWAGYGARGIILGIIGFFFIKAGITQNARYIVNTDKAFDFIGDQVGHLYFILVALGTISYGLFMATLGFYFDSDKD